MKPSIITFLLVACVIMEETYCKLQKVQIKSHKVLTKNIFQNEVQLIYDNNMSTTGSFYNTTPTTVEVEFDLEANYVIEKIEATIDSKNPEISFIVGNYISGEGGLAFNCFLGKKGKHLYECLPKCRVDDSTRNGIMARKLMMSFSISNVWRSIYEISVYTKLKNKDISSISDYRLVQPDNCDSKSWLINNPEASNNTKIAHQKGTKIFLEKPYIVTTVDVQFVENNPKALKIQLLNGDKKQDVELDLAKCTFDASKFTCQLQKSIFPTRIVKIVSSGVSSISFHGKTVFYPTLSIKASDNKKQDLKLTCYINPCDLSIHSGCLQDSIKPGMEFPCNNRRLFKIPSGGTNLDTFVIVNQGEVEKVWSKTQFAVETNLESKMVVSMPRSYQYFGQYKCSCVVGDELESEMHSNDTTLADGDFIENGDLIFKTDIQFKIQDSDKSFKDANENIIAIPEKLLFNSFIRVKVTSLSLINGLSVDAVFSTDQNTHETATVDTFSTETVRAFDNIPETWSVQAYKYVLDDFYPEFIHNKDVVIKYNSKTHNITQKNLIRLLRVDKNMNTKPELVKEITNKSISIKVVYNGNDKQMVTVTEANCLKTSTQKLAILSKNNCTSFNKQVSCSKLEDVPFLSIKQERNIATTYTYSFLNTETNFTSYIYVNGSQQPDVKDVKTKWHYIDFANDPINPDITIIQLELEVISKTINDFIPCGKVTLKTIESGKPVKELVLQKPKYRFSVDLIENFVNVTIKLEINDKQVYSVKLDIINPKMFEVGKLAIQGKTNLQASWKGIDKMAYGLLVGYDVKIVATKLPCNTNYDRTFMMNKTGTMNERNSYLTEVGSVHDKHNSMFVVSVQPVFLNGKRGKLSQSTKKIIYQKKTKVVISNVVLSKQKSISIIPSQLDLPCKVKSVNFGLTGLNVKNVLKNVKMVDGNNYIIENLIPGRKYQLTAQAVYQGGPEDTISKTYDFETADEISISQDRHVAQVNEKINITCEADIGPSDEFQKTVKWFRSTKGPLPDGVISQTINNKAFLIMEKTVSDYTDVYGCFVEPSASVGSARIHIIINDLVVTPTATKVDYSVQQAQQQPISVKCSTSLIVNLTWTGPDNLLISNENENYKIETVKTTYDTVESTLIIKNPSLKTSGKYNCLKSIDHVKASRQFLLYGEEKLDLTLLPNSSKHIGKTTRIRCAGQVALKTQKVIWDVSSLVTGTKNLVKVITPDPADLYTQDIEIINDLAIHSVSCKISPPVNATSTEMKKSYNIKLDAKIEVDGPTNVMAGKPVNLTCTGYPIKPSMILQWVFYKEKSTNTTGVVVSSSKDQSSPKSYEPIKLILKLTNVKENEAGRYECKFKTELQAEKFTSKSLSLSVNTNQDTLINVGRSVGSPGNKPNNSAHSILSNTKLSISVSALFLVFLVFDRI